MYLTLLKELLIGLLRAWAWPKPFLPWAGYGWFCKPMAQARPYFLAWQFSRLDGKGICILICILKGPEWLTYLTHKDVNRLGQAGTTVSRPTSLYNEESESRSNTQRYKYDTLGNGQGRADPEILSWKSHYVGKKKVFGRATLKKCI